MTIEHKRAHSFEIQESQVFDTSNLVPLKAVLSPETGIGENALARYDRTMYALGGVDAKAVVLLYGLTPNPKQIRRIHDDVQAQLPENLWVPSNQTIENSYLLSGFCPTGVTYQARRDGWSVYYGTTEEGERFTKGAAALFLKYSYDHDYPILTLFRTMSPPGSPTQENSRNRAYIARSAILLNLAQKPSYEYEMMRKLGLGQSVVGEHLEVLRDAGFIHFESADMETKGWGVYERVGEIDQVVHSAQKNRLRRNVLEYFRSNTVANAQTIVKALGRVDEIDVFRILSELVDDGFLKRPKWYGGVQQSEASLVHDGKEYQGKILLSEVIVPLLKACAGDPTALRNIEETRRAVEQDAQIAARVTQIYREATTKTARTETAYAILDIIATDGPTRPQSIIAVLGGRSAPVLSDLVLSGKLEKYEVGKASYYLLPGMKLPEHKGSVIIFQYSPPDKLLPPTCYPKEKYAADLETKEFWEGLLTDLRQIPVKAVTEAVFFYDYDPNNPHWQEKDDYHGGRYLNHILALRRLGIRNPYRFLHTYQPTSLDPEFSTLVEQSQQLMKIRLIETKQVKRWEDYYDEFHTEKFWQNLIIDMEHAPEGLLFFQFLAFYSEGATDFYDKGTTGKYFNLYSTARAHTGNGIVYLRDFSPTLPHSPELEELIKNAQQIIRNKFTFNRTRRSPEKWGEVLEEPEFWEEFERDVVRCPDAETFYNFIVHFDENNADLSVKRQSNGKMQLGKYYLLIFSGATHEVMRAAVPNLEDLSAETMTSLNSVVKPYVYVKASPLLRKALLQKFPAEFRPVAKALAQLTARQDVLPVDATAEEETYIVQTLVQEQAFPVTVGEKEIIRKSLRQTIASATEKYNISQRQASILQLRFGLIGQRALGLDEIAVRFGLNKQKVVDLLVGALEGLQIIPVLESDSRVAPVSAQDSGYESIAKEWNPAQEVEDVIQTSQNPKIIPILRKIQEFHNPAGWKEAVMWDLDTMKKLARRLPLERNKVDFAKLGISSYIAVVADFITSVEFGDIRAFDPDDVAVYSVFKEDLSACIELIEKLDKNMNLAELFRKEVQKAVKKLLSEV